MPPSVVQSSRQGSSRTSVPRADRGVRVRLLLDPIHPIPVSITATKVRPGSIVFSQRDSTPYLCSVGMLPAGGVKVGAFEKSSKTLRAPALGANANSADSESARNERSSGFAMVLMRIPFARTAFDPANGSRPDLAPLSRRLSTAAAGLIGTKPILRAASKGILSTFLTTMLQVVADRPLLPELVTKTDEVAGRYRSD